MNLPLPPPPPPSPSNTKFTESPGFPLTVFWVFGTGSYSVTQAALSLTMIFMTLPKSFDDKGSEALQGWAAVCGHSDTQETDTGPDGSHAHL